MDHSFATTSGKYVIIREYEMIRVGIRREILHNEFDCPLLEKTDRLVIVPITTFTIASIVHECTGSCCFVTRRKKRKIEMEQISNDTLIFEHDTLNNMYCLNIYCMKYYHS